MTLDTNMPHKLSKMSSTEDTSESEDENNNKRRKLNKWKIIDTKGVEPKVHMKKKLDEKSVTNNGIKSAKQEHECSGCYKFGCKQMYHETYDAHGQDVLEGTCEGTCDDANEKFQGLPITAKRATHKMLHVLPNSTPAVVHDELRKNKQMKRAYKSQREQTLSCVRNYQCNVKNNMMEDSHAVIYECVQLHDGKDVNNMPEDTDEPAVIKYVIYPERTHVVITAKRMLELMTHKDLQAACEVTEKLLMHRWPFVAFGVVDRHRHFHPTGCLFANKVDTDAYV